MLGRTFHTLFMQWASTSSSILPGAQFTEYIVSLVAAALIIADKSDVHRSRVQNPNEAEFDIHDRVNYAVEKSFVRVDAEARKISLELTIDTASASVMEYFEIFLSCMVMTRNAAGMLGCVFELVANEERLS